jgi:hypothetical protein
LIILWVSKRKDEEGKNPSEDDQESYRKHNEIMKKFRIAHPERKLKIVHPKDIIKASGHLLVPADVAMENHR